MDTLERSMADLKYAIEQFRRNAEQLVESHDALDRIVYWHIEAGSGPQDWEEDEQLQAARRNTEVSWGRLCNSFKWVTRRYREATSAAAQSQLRGGASLEATVNAFAEAAVALRYAKETYARFKTQQPAPLAAEYEVEIIVSP